MKRQLIYFMGLIVLLITACSKGTPDNPHNTDDPQLPGKATVLAEVDLPELGASVPVIANTNEVPISADELEHIEGMNDFAYRMYAQQAKSYEGKNLILSPLSWDYALGMIATGAADHVLAEIVGTMGWADLNRIDIPVLYKDLTRHLETSSSFQRVFVANSLWVNEDKVEALNPEYPKILTENFGAGMSALDLSDPNSIEHINKWIERKTYSKIQNMLPTSIASNNLLFILTNALYFKSPWMSPFEKANTKKDEFTAANAKVQEVEMMTTVLEETFVDLPDVQILRIPTEGRAFFVDIILPKDKTKPLSADFLTKYAPHEVFKKYSRRLPIRVYLPKFKFTTDLLTLIDSRRPELAEELGLSQMLLPNSLTKIMNNPMLKLSKVVQKCMVGWDEKGVEAAAATAVIVIEKSLPPTTAFEFKVDHPFFFAITHASSGKLMFVGQVNEI